LDVGGDAALTTSMVNHHDKGAKRTEVEMAIDSVPADIQSRADRLTQSDRSSPGGVIAVPPVISLIVIGLSSLGLWVAIGWAVTSLGSARLW